jgi:hypothetical protein
MSTRFPDTDVIITVSGTAVSMKAIID